MENIFESTARQIEREAAKTTVLLNPFSVRLEKDPFMEMRSTPIYTQGDFKIYKPYDKHYIHAFKNIVIAERCAPNKEIFTNLTGETKPTDEARIYFDLDRPKEAMQDGIREAKKLKFIIS